MNFRILFREFFSNYFSFDSRFGRSFKPFLLRPGRLTEAFNEGKRVRYAHPMRLYLVISLIHFSLFAAVVSVDEVITLDRLDDEEKAELDSLLAIGPSAVEIDEEDWPANEWEDVIIELMVDEGHSVDEILDSLHADEKSYLDAYAMRRYIRLQNSTEASIQAAIVQNIPVMMFFILPLYALLLKVFYWRKGKYIHHLIHSFHIHSFTFFVMSIAWAIVLISGLEIETQAVTVALILTTVYLFLSLRKVYRQSKRATLAKLFSLGFIYSILLSFALLIELLISVLVLH
ncbi:MAG: DUF3667 domain-containing protein [Bacteroidota bacterium]